MNVEIVKAFHFAAQKHTDQRRKGEKQEPYINHISEVAYLLAESVAGENANLIIAGILHDTVEDTETTMEEIESQFGIEVAQIVAEVTDDKSLPKEKRKQLQVL